MFSKVRVSMILFTASLLPFLCSPAGGESLRPGIMPPPVAGNFEERLSRTTSPVAPEPTGINAGARTAGATEGWWQTASASIERQEYNASSTAQGLQAPNRGQNLRTYFRSDGIEVVPREHPGTDPAWRFSWRTTAWGREGRLRALASAGNPPHSAGTRVTYDRAGLTEWYENTRRGLEQGFTIAARPSGSGPLCIRGMYAPQLKAEFVPAEGAVDFLDGHGVRVLRYGGLRVKDAAGTEVSSRLELTGGELSIVMDDAHATYPLTVDPILTSPSWTGEGGQTGARFGISVGTAGDVNDDGFSDVIVGADFYDGGQSNEGRAFVFLGSPSGLAAAPAWTADGDQAGERFGVSVGTAGDVNGDGYADVIIGAEHYNIGQADVGRAYVYLGSSIGLSTNPTWTADGSQAGDLFGWLVSTAGDVNGDGYADVIVGAPETDNLQGRAYLYLGSSSGPATTAAWTATSGQAGAEFGRVGAAGDVNGDGFADVIVGAMAYDGARGRAYVYLGSPTGLASSPVWTAESDQVAAYFGYVAGTAGDVNGDGYADIVVGAPGYNSNKGKIWVYLGNASGVATAPAWSAENDLGGQFATSGATAGDINGDGFADIIVGAPLYGTTPDNAGKAYVYLGSAGGLAANPAWTVAGGQASAQYGYSVATAGDVNGDGLSDLIIGALNYTNNGLAGEGMAFVYNGSADGLAANAAWTAESDQASAWFGNAVSTAGDVNGDGYSDLIVGAPSYDNGQTDEGRTYLYLGSAEGLVGGAAWSAEGDHAHASFGSSVATAGDVNGDGYDDVIIGAPQYSNGQPGEGRAYVFLGSAGGLGASPAWAPEGDQADAGFGFTAKTAGDVNGDGYSDVIVGAPGYSIDPQYYQGRAFLYLGSPDGLGTSAAWTVDGILTEESFGYAAGTAGDVNGDGYSDIIVGTFRLGVVYAFLGSANGLSPVAAWTAVGAGDFGVSLDAAGDVNGDGYSDVIIGQPSYGSPSRGRACVYLGSAGGLSSSISWTAEGDQDYAQFGRSVDTAGDVNGDGYSDVVVGAYGYSDGQAHEGRAFAYLGTPGGLSSGPAWTAESDQEGAYFGWSVGTAGDTNGDGFSDVVVGAYNFDNGQSNEGRTYLYYGNSGDGLDRAPRQARTDDAAPIALLGRSNSPDGFLLKARGRTPAGRGGVRMQCEVKPAGTAFDGTALLAGSWVNTGSPAGDGSSVGLSTLVAGLGANSLYHWRLRTMSDSPFFPRSPWFTLPYNSVTEADVRTAEGTVDAVEDPGAGAIHLLGRVAPNPIVSSAGLSYLLPKRGRVRIGVEDVAGREVAVLLDREEATGPHLAHWDGTGARGARLPAGVYFVRLAFGGREEARKVILAP
jgi:hypothetical protein